MKWQELFLQDNYDECLYWNKYRRDGEITVSYLEMFINDGRLEEFFAITTPADIDFRRFPELDFTQKQRDSLKLNREVTDLMNQWNVEFGNPLDECLEDSLIREGRLESYLRSPLLGKRYNPE